MYRRETRSGTLRQLRGGRAGRQTREGVFGAWQMQGLIAGTPHWADPGTSSGDAGGSEGAGLGHSLPILPGPPPTSFQSFRQGSPGQAAAWPHSASLGTSEASARQMGHVRLACGNMHVRRCSHQPQSTTSVQPPGGTWSPGARTSEMMTRTRRETAQASPSPRHCMRNTQEPAWAVLPSTTCQHTSCGTHGCRGGLGAAAAPRSH